MNDLTPAQRFALNEAWSHAENGTPFPPFEQGFRAGLAFSAQRQEGVCGDCGGTGIYREPVEGVAAPLESTCSNCSGEEAPSGRQAGTSEVSEDEEEDIHSVFRDAANVIISDAPRKGALSIPEILGTLAVKGAVDEREPTCPPSGDVDSLREGAWACASCNCAIRPEEVKPGLECVICPLCGAASVMPMATYEVRRMRERAEAAETKCRELEFDATVPVAELTEKVEFLERAMRGQGLALDAAVKRAEAAERKLKDVREDLSFAEARIAEAERALIAAEQSQDWAETRLVEQVNLTVEAEQERDRLRAAIDDALSALGDPDHFDGCEGCRADVHAAVDGLRTALAESQPSGDEEGKGFEKGSLPLAPEPSGAVGVPTPEPSPEGTNSERVLTVKLTEAQVFYIEQKLRPDPATRVGYRTMADELRDGFKNAVLEAWKLPVTFAEPQPKEPNA